MSAIEFGVCPVCEGAKKIALTDSEKKHAWNQGRTHWTCTNCGGHYQSGSASGLVRLNRQGKPCEHKYVSSHAGRCLTNYECEHCGDRYQIDSGD